MVSTKLFDGGLESVKVFFDNKLIDERTENVISVQLGCFSQTGQLSVKIIAKKTDGVENTKLSTLLVLSDIIPKTNSYKIKKEYPHSNKFFTQGLEFHDGFFYEGTGENGSSGLYKVNPFTGTPVLSKRLEDKHFGEGITVLNDKIYQITYKTQTGFVYKRDDFARIDSFKFSSPEGWGLTNDGKYLIMSNGTQSLFWINPSDYSVVKTVQVCDNKELIKNLNELEYFDDKIYANLWTTNLIAEIDPKSGRVLSYIDMKGLLSIMYQQKSERIDVLNGIAYDSKNKRIYVTGKLWPKLFEIDIIRSE